MRIVLKLVKVASSMYYYWRSLKNNRGTTKGTRQGKRPPGYSLGETEERIKDEDIISKIR